MLKLVLKLPGSVFILLLAATALLLTIALQYPLSTTFPIGGDAASHIRAAQNILNGQQAILTLRTSNYPLSNLILSGFAVLPGTWPDRFVAWITIGHILAGGALAALLWRIGSAYAAAAGLAIWALTPVGINTHFEDGTAPQLWSLIFLLLTFERLAAGKRLSTVIFFTAAALTHFLTGFVLAASLTMGTLVLLPIRRQLAAAQARLIKYLAVLIAALAVLSIRRVIRGLQLPFVESQAKDYFLLDVLRSKFTPWLVVSLPGLAVMVRQLRRSLPTATSLLSFLWLSFLLTTNSSFSTGLWENRFRTYFITAVCLAAGLALPALVQSAFRSAFLQLLFVSLLFTTTAALTWKDNADTYRYYETPNNQTLPPDARSAIGWLADHAPANSVIASTTATRYGEWIPVLTSLRWHELSANHPLLSASGEELSAAARTAELTHLIFFTHHEDVNPALRDNRSSFIIPFTNSSTVIVQLL
ncbi:MAG: hypothetical protein HY372_02225 [Candidatus Andersenbacteria bacterium]|nr:hypothetical protein [Candidatus Andersenbacteria bacterium]